MARFIGTNAPLAAAAVWQDTLNAGREDTLVGMVFSDQGGTLNIEHSADGQNWDVNEPVTVAAGVGQVFERKVYAPHFRLRYVNGATQQGVFRLTARFSSAGPR
jgi:hypothetical protein